MPTRKSSASKKFPPAGVDLIEHELAVDMLQIKGRQKEESLLETLLFKGRMTVRRRDPDKIKRGKFAGSNRIEFDVLTWVASAFSEKLQAEILYILSEGTEQKRSTITAEQPDADFPAEFDFNVIFDARVNNRTVKRRHHGRPHGGGFNTVPPRRGSPTIRGFESNFIEVKHPEHGLVRFVPRECNDQNGETVVALNGG